MNISTDMDPGPDGHTALEQTLDRLADRATAWAAASPKHVVRLLRLVRERVVAHADDWVGLACSIKSIARGSPCEGEEWLGGPVALLNTIDGLLASFSGSPAKRLRWREQGPGRRMARVFPRTLLDRLLLNGVRADVVVQDGVRASEHRERSAPSVTLVLGAGNVSSIAPMDALYHLLHRRSPVLVKLNPVLDRFAPLLDEIFIPLVREDLLAFITGDADTGSWLTRHPRIDHIHVTGSEATHNAIVYGTGEEGARALQADKPKLAKSVSSELGGICPTIVLPGKWTKADLRFQAEHIVTQKYNNGGFNCVAVQVLVVPELWEQRVEFLDAIKDVVAGLQSRTLYYPGSQKRLAAIGIASEGPSVELLRVRPDQNSPLFTTEIFGPAMAVVELKGDTATAFLENAVEFANRDLRGTLGANVIVDPVTRSRMGKSFDEIVSNLRYGTVAINAWTGVGYLLTATPWGAYPGHSSADVQSGVGIVHNDLQLEDTEKSIVEAPFRPFPRSLLHGSTAILPRPPWFVTSRTGTVTCKRLFEFYARPGPVRLVRVLASALAS